MAYRDSRFGELTNRSPLLAQILQQMQQQSRFQPQSYGALAAGLGASYFDQKNLQKELAKEQQQKESQAQALAQALSKYTQQSEGGPVNIPLDNPAGGTDQMQQNYMADPKGARQGLAGALAGLGYGDQALSFALTPPAPPKLVGQMNPDGTTSLAEERPGLITGRPKPEAAGSPIGKLQEDLAAGRISPEQYNTALQIMSKPLVAVGADNKPLTEPAKLRADLDAGRISQADFERAITSHRQASGEILVKQGLMNSAEKSLGEARKILFKDGAYRSGLVTQMLSPIRTGNAAKLYTFMREAVSNRLRAESGATITDQEVDDQLQRFMPKPWEGRDIAEQKFNNFQSFIDEFRSSISGSDKAPASAGTLQFDKDGNEL